MEKYTIDVSKLVSDEVEALLGRDNGRIFLNELEKKYQDLAKLERNYSSIAISIPKKIVTMNKSFFLGAFTNSVSRLGKEKFLTQYVFSSNKLINAKIPSFVEYALKTTSMRELFGSKN